VRVRDYVTCHEKRLVWRFAGYAAPAPHSPRPETPLKLARKWLRDENLLKICVLVIIAVNYFNILSLKYLIHVQFYLYLSYIFL